MAWWQTILRALWLFLPAYVANMAPVFVAKLLPKWNARIDGGRVAKDGRPLLGAGKTWRGLAGGIVLAGTTALAMAAIAPHWDLVRGWDFGAQARGGGDIAMCTPTGPCNNGTAALWQVFLFGAVVGLFALSGDAVKSYFKRRRGKEGGAPWVPFDQLDFVVFGLAGMVLAFPLLPYPWVLAALFGDWLVLATLLVLTPFLHLAVNRLGYWLRLKKVPW